MMGEPANGFPTPYATLPMGTSTDAVRSLHLRAYRRTSYNIIIRHVSIDPLSDMGKVSAKAPLSLKILSTHFRVSEAGTPLLSGAQMNF